MKSIKALNRIINFNSRDSDTPAILRCAHCGDSPTKLHKCATCQNAYYCGASHQKAHFAVHKKVCCPYAIKVRTIDGQQRAYVVAKHDIEAKQLIFMDKSIISSPTQFQDKHDSKLSCVGCLTEIEPGIPTQCPKCNWPICSYKCKGLKADNNSHSKICHILKMAFTVAFKKDFVFRREPIFILQCCVLQNENPKKLEHLMMGVDLTTDLLIKFNGFYEYMEKYFFAPLREQQQFTKKIVLGDTSFETIGQMFALLYYKTEDISFDDLGAINVLMATMNCVNNSCVPNAHPTYHPLPESIEDATLRLYAIKAIKKNEEITLSRGALDLPTPKRRISLLYKFNIECKCPRCLDPTEFGTYFNGILCKAFGNKCETGVMVQMNPLDLESDWACTKCMKQVSWETVTRVEFEISEERDNYKMLESLEACAPMLFLKIESLSKIAHPNHKEVFEMKLNFITIDDTKFPIECLLAKERYCKQLLDVAYKFDPHTKFFINIIVQIYYNMHCVVMQKVLWKMKYGYVAKFNSEAIAAHKLAGQFLVKATEILQNDPFRFPALLPLLNIAKNELFKAQRN